MLKAFVEKIQELTFHTFERNGRMFTTQKVFPIRQEEPGTLRVRTLKGILDYVRAEKELNPDHLFVHVEDHKNVWLYTNLYGTEKQRDIHIKAEAYDIKNSFGESLPLDTFLTYVQAGFVQDENTALLLRALGNIVDETAVEYADDGVTQQVTARTGITRREIVKLPNPIALRPYRTFPDIEQPEGLFVLRVNKRGEAVMCALHEADGGAWKNKAVASIKNWFLDAGMERGMTLNVVG